MTNVTEVPEEDVLRAHYYRFLARILAKPADRATLDDVARLEGDETELGRALNALAREAAKTTPEAADDEFHALFIGLGRGELVPFASYYLTGFLNEKPLARLRHDMDRIGIARAEEVHEPEDQIASLCEMMAGLIMGEFDQSVDFAGQAAFYAAHVQPWTKQFFEDLESAKGASLYRPVGTLGRLFMSIEDAAFQMAV